VAGLDLYRFLVAFCGSLFPLDRVLQAKSKNLLWRGLATEDLSTKADKNTKQLDGDINKMFKGFPPKAG
jgi:hypothetical protein